MRRRLLIPVVAVAAAGALLAGFGWLGDADRSITEQRGRVEAAGIRVDSRLFLPDDGGSRDRVPAVLVAHGLGEDQDDVREFARRLARAGYVVRTWTSRGTGKSEGRVGIAAPDGEVADVAALVNQLATRDDVLLDEPGDPRVAIVGTSHGGGVALLAAAQDHRIDAVVPIFAWHDLASALEPQGVLKLRWGSELFAAGSVDGERGDTCGSLEREPCEAWQDSASAGRLTPAAHRLLDERSPSSLADELRAPTLIVHGQMDSLFGLDQAVRLAATLERNTVPVRVEWVRAGHDQPFDQRRRDHVERAILRWFDKHLRGRGDVDAAPRFTVELGAGRGHAHTPRIPPRFDTRALELEPVDEVDDQGFVRLVAPAAGLPADVTTLPGLGDMTAIEPGFTPPRGQRARFRTSRVDAGVEIIGSPRVRLQFTGSRADGIAFVRLVDVAADGRRIVPRGLVSPVRLERLPPLGAARGRTVSVALPYIAWRLAPGHHLEVEVTSTDAGFVAPRAPMTLAVGLVGSGTLRVPEVDEPARTSASFEAGRDWRDLLAVAAALALLALGAGLATARVAGRRDARVQEPGLRDVPMRADRLVKRFGDGRVAVDGVSFTVGAGSIVGLVGPNGAGKTTVLRMLLGLVHPTDGFAHVYGQRIRPGVPRLARVGAMVEGPGLAPHLTGRQHLVRHWAATGRPMAAADIDAALGVVSLLDDADRPVRTWSHGMRQRLGIAQALLGSPSVVLLDEPANGLDPAQITQLRELVRSIAADGRAVLLSSHLLAELEQVCTHVVLMSEGRVLQSGTLAHVVADHGSLERAFLAHVEGRHDA